tara:strand:+ start:8427 stop:8648 length:222 start_codon:yes stop_codon:yes gene_type:complete
MEKDIYFENINISISTVTSFKRAYEEKKKEVISDLRKNLKEKYNIDINESNLSTDIRATPTREYDDPSTYISK